MRLSVLIISLSLTTSGCNGLTILLDQKGKSNETIVAVNPEVLAPPASPTPTPTPTATPTPTPTPTSTPTSTPTPTPTPTFPSTAPAPSSAVGPTLTSSIVLNFTPYTHRNYNAENGISTGQLTQVAADKMRITLGSGQTAQMGRFENGDVYIVTPPGQTVSIQSIEVTYPDNPNTWRTWVGAELNPYRKVKQGYYCPSGTTTISAYGQNLSLDQYGTFANCDTPLAAAINGPQPFQVTGVANRVDNLLVAIHFPNHLPFLWREHPPDFSLSVFRFIDRMVTITFLNSVPPLGALRPALVGSPVGKPIYNVDNFRWDLMTTQRANAIASYNSENIFQAACRSSTDPDYLYSPAYGNSVRPAPYTYGANAASYRTQLAEFAMNPNTPPALRRKYLVCLWERGQTIAANIFVNNGGTFEPGGHSHSRLMPMLMFVAATQDPALMALAREWSRTRRNLNSNNRPVFYDCPASAPNCQYNAVFRALGEPEWIITTNTNVTPISGYNWPFPIKTFYGGPHHWDMPYGTNTTMANYDFDGGISYGYGSYFATVNSAIAHAAYWALALPQPGSVLSLMTHPEDTRPAMIEYACRFRRAGIYSPGHASHGASPYDLANQFDANILNALTGSCNAWLLTQ